MEPIIISLEPNPDYWLELYFVNGNDTLLGNQWVKYSFRYFTLCSALLILFFVLYICDHSFIPGVWGATFFFVLCLIDLIRRFKKYYTWRKAVLKYLKDFHKITRYELALSEDHIETILNGRSYNKEKWSSFEKVELTKRGLRLYHPKTLYPIPSKAMSQENFDILFNFAEERIKFYEGVPEEEEEEEEYKGHKWSN